jgi:hypothetical protein
MIATRLSVPVHPAWKVVRPDGSHIGSQWAIFISSGQAIGVVDDRPGSSPWASARVRPQYQGWAGSPLIRNGTVTMLDATPRSLRSAALMRPSLFRSGTTFGASLKMPS